MPLVRIFPLQHDQKQQRQEQQDHQKQDQDQNENQGQQQNGQQGLSPDVVTDVITRVNPLDTDGNDCNNIVDPDDIFQNDLKLLIFKESEKLEEATNRVWLLKFALHQFTISPPVVSGGSVLRKSMMKGYFIVFFNKKNSSKLTKATQSCNLCCLMHDSHVLQARRCRPTLLQFDLLGKCLTKTLLLLFQLSSSLSLLFCGRHRHSFNLKLSECMVAMGSKTSLEEFRSGSSRVSLMTHWLFQSSGSSEELAFGSNAIFTFSLREKCKSCIMSRKKKGKVTNICSSNFSTCRQGLLNLFQSTSRNVSLA